MTPAEFKAKWGRVRAKESAAYQSHFDDLCRMLGHPPPLEADPSGDFFCFQKRVVKDAELFELKDSGEEAEASERGFADVWKKDCFAWEYKGRKRNLDEAYRQLLRYRESLLNPPLLVVCDFDRFVIRTNFNGTVQETHEFTNDQIDRPENLRTLRALFESPDFLKPQRTANEITTRLAEQFAQVARSLQKREALELADVKTRAEMNFAQRKNLRIARFLNRLVFCFFAEDTGLLPKALFSDLAKTALEDPRHFAQTLETLFRTMATGGSFGHHKIRHFNGHLFEDSTVFELNEEERQMLVEAAGADWQYVEPSIMGTLFARGLDPDQRAALGAQYTHRDDIVTLVEPVLMATLRREWATLKASLLGAVKLGKGQAADRGRIEAFLKKVRGVVVMDPACGSGNFLYVSLQMLLDLEKEAITLGTQLGFTFKPEVGVHQLRAIEINPYAYELAQVTVQIGYLQWLRSNGFPVDREPVLRVLDGFHNEDALLVPHFRNKATSLKQAQAGEHADDNALKFYTEREWPACSVIVGNPPFLGDKLMRGQLGDGYVEELRRIYGDRLPGQSDLCCYWFEKARDLIERDKCRRAGLLATQGIRGGANREVLKRIKASGDIFFAESDRPWILDGANVHVSMVGFDDGSEEERRLDDRQVPNIGAQLSSETDLVHAARLAANADMSFIGASMHGPFPVDEAFAMELILTPNPGGMPSSDLVRLWCNGMSIVQRAPDMWIVDVPPHLSLEQAAQFEQPFEHLRRVVLPVREKNRRPMRRKNWWLLGDPQKAMRFAVSGLPRYLATPRLAKHRVFVWMPSAVLATDQVVAFARADDYALGVLHSHVHEIWALRQGTRLETRPRYTPTTCFETFPFPRPTPAQEGAIAEAAKDLNEMRERWLNPPEWTETRVLEFPGTMGGPWDRFIDRATVEDRGGFQVGTVRYPRLEPRDTECAAKLKRRTLTNLYNGRPAWLTQAHQKLDAAVAAAYGWPADLTDEQILERLLALNLERAAETERAAQKAPAKASRAKREDEMI